MFVASFAFDEGIITYRVLSVSSKAMARTTYKNNLKTVNMSFNNRKRIYYFRSLTYDTQEGDTAQLLDYVP